MTMANRKDMISSEEVRIMLLEQKNDDFNQALNRIEKRFDHIDQRFDLLDKKFDQVDKRFDRLEARIDNLDSRIDSNFKWILGFIIPGFLGVLGLIAHGFKWL